MNLEIAPDGVPDDKQKFGLSTFSHWFEGKK